MFGTAKCYAIVSNSSFIIKKEDDYAESVIELESFIPNVPAYHHLFDKDKEGYLKDIRSQIKSLKVKDVTIIMPDDSVDIEVDKRILIEFFLQSGVKKVQVNFQCFFLSLDNKKYIAVSRTARNLVVQYIAYNKSVAKKFYDKNYTDIKQIIIDTKNLHIDCTNDMMPVYVNNINNDMEGFMDIGKLVSLKDLSANIANNRL